MATGSSSRDEGPLVVTGASIGMELPLVNVGVLGATSAWICVGVATIGSACSGVACGVTGVACCWATGWVGGVNCAAGGVGCGGVAVACCAAEEHKQGMVSPALRQSEVSEYFL